MARLSQKAKAARLRPAVYDRQGPKAAVPSRSEWRRNKPGFSGLRFEDHVRRAFAAEGMAAHRRPGQRSYRLSTQGGGFVPDLAMTFFGLEAFGVEEAPNALKTWRAPANILIECKRQTVSGSADVKIGAAMKDLAHVSDVTNTIGVMILDVTVFNRRRWAVLRRQADILGIVLLTAEQLKRRTVLREVRRIAIARQELRKKFHPGSAKPKARFAGDDDVVQFLAREVERRSLSR